MQFKPFVGKNAANKKTAATSAAVFMGTTYYLSIT